jgi:hypothetical protein
MRQPNRSSKTERPAEAEYEGTPSEISPEDWIARLLQLESAKTDALIAFDSEGYEASATEQSRLVDSGVPDLRSLPRDRARSFAMKARLNSALLLNLFSISPHFALAVQAYGPDGVSSAPPPRAEQFHMEA